MHNRDHKRRRVKKRNVAERFDVCPRTIERWVKAGILSKPDIINGHWYFDEETLDADDARRQAAAVDASHGSAGIEA